jgi:signal transduction histidine kinase
MTEPRRLEDLALAIVAMASNPTVDGIMTSAIASAARLTCAGFGVFRVLGPNSAPAPRDDMPDAADAPDPAVGRAVQLDLPVWVAGAEFGSLSLSESVNGRFSEQDEELAAAVAAAAGAALAERGLDRVLATDVAQQTRATTSLVGTRYLTEPSAAVLEDRERISKRLHDDVMQQLFGIGLSLEATAGGMEPGEVTDRIHQRVGEIDDVITRIRACIFS